ncbi:MULTISPECIES: hypothetical protein [unclassified Sphingomonas]|jgi:hypothetical protein|uniref:hypothetical protein n=1 Tax=unclassified Sphingomonas TaxID=196159 RepID=UPI000AE9216C|nr:MULTISPECIES: hypothetical protein [unclassified Sphingomonas]MCH4893516.1 hypothetical protein [Sphingomonas sp. SFZ2018-12]
MASSNTEYYARRAEQARLLADRAADQCARSAHLTMAKRYGELAARDAQSAAGETAPTN